jgi:hypothetical protein
MSVFSHVLSSFHMTQYTYRNISASVLETVKVNMEKKNNFTRQSPSNLKQTTFFSHETIISRSKIYTSTQYIVICMSDSRQGSGLDIGFIDHFNTRLVITLNYRAIVNLHNSQITTAPVKLFPAVSSPAVP